MLKEVPWLITFFSSFDAYTSPSLAQLNFLKHQDHINTYKTLYFIHQFKTVKLPNIFDSFLVKTPSKLSNFKL